MDSQNMQGIIDVHSHPLVKPFTDALTSDETGDMTLPPWSPEMHLETMDRNGIAVCMLSVNNMEDAMAKPQNQSLARRINEELASLVAKYPTRFGAFAAVPMHDVDAAIAEMTYCLDVLKMDGVCASPHFEWDYLGEPRFDPWFEEMNRRGVTLFVHPGESPGFEPKKSKMNVSVVEFMFDSTRMVANMVLSGAKERFDKINIISTHAGGTIPFLAHRLGIISEQPWAYRDGPKLTKERTKAALASFYFDLTASAAPVPLNALRALVPPEQLLMGFDFPLMPAHSIPPAIQSFSAYGAFDDAQAKSKIISGNAKRLFPRLAKV